MFRWLGPFPTHDYDLWNRTSGQKVPFWAFGIGPSAEVVGKSQGEVYKNNALGKNDHVWTFFGSMDGHIVPTTEKPLFSLDGIAYSAAVLFSETLFLRIGPLFRRLGPRVSLIRTFSKTQRTYSNETPCMSGRIEHFF